MSRCFCLKGDRGPRHCLYFKYKGTSYKLKIPFQDTASIENAISCLMALYFDYDIATIQSRMLLLFPEMRLKVKTESIIVVLSMIVTVLIFSL
jgi:hypothetical protein